MSQLLKYPQISPKFICEKCDYKCSKQSEFNKHISTNKHKTIQTPITEVTPKVYVCGCGKIYKHLLFSISII